MKRIWPIIAVSDVPSSATWFDCNVGKLAFVRQGLVCLGLPGLVLAVTRPSATLSQRAQKERGYVHNWWRRNTLVGEP